MSCSVVNGAVGVLDDGPPGLGDFKVDHDVQADRTQDSDDNSSIWLFNLQIEEGIVHLPEVLVVRETP